MILKNSKKQTNTDITNTKMRYLWTIATSWFSTSRSDRLAPRSGRGGVAGGTHLLTFHPLLRSSATLGHPWPVHPHIYTFWHRHVQGIPSSGPGEAFGTSVGNQVVQGRRSPHSGRMNHVRMYFGPSFVFLIVFNETRGWNFASEKSRAAKFFSRVNLKRGVSLLG